MSDSLLPRGLQHARPACPSPTPAACSNSCPLSRWCCPTVSPSVVPFSSRPHRCLRWWWTGRPGGLQSTGHKRVGRNWATEQRQTFLIFSQIFRYERLNKKCLSFCKDLFQFKFFSISDYIIKRFFFPIIFYIFLITYSVQAWSAHLMRGQWIPELRCWGKEEALTGEPADLEDHWLAPQNNHLIGVWMPGSFVDQRERSNVVQRSKGKLER